MLEKIKKFFKGLSIRTGIILLIICVLLYVVALIQPLLPISKVAKAIIFATSFGLAKIFQYSAIAVLGVKGWQILKRKLGIKKNRVNKN